MIQKTLFTTLLLALLIGCTTSEPIDTLEDKIHREAMACVARNARAQYRMLDREKINNPFTAKKSWEAAQVVKAFTKELGDSLQTADPEKLKKAVNQFRMGTAETMRIFEGPWTEPVPELMEQAAASGDTQSLRELIHIWEWNTTRFLYGHVSSSHFFPDTLIPMVSTLPQGYQQGEEAMTHVFVSFSNTRQYLDLRVGSSMDDSDNLLDPQENRSVRKNGKAYVKLNTANAGIINETVEVAMRVPRGDTLRFALPLIYKVHEQ